MFEKCVLTIVELNWNQRLGHKKTKLKICHHMLTSSTQQQNRSFQVVERTRTSSKCQKMKYARAKRAKILFFIVKYANLWGFCCCRRRGCLSSLIIAGICSIDLLSLVDFVFSNTDHVTIPRRIFTFKVGHFNARMQPFSEHYKGSNLLDIVA